jgi:hypothetical protein
MELKGVEPAAREKKRLGVNGCVDLRVASPAPKSGDFGLRLRAKRGEAGGYGINEVSLRLGAERKSRKMAGVLFWQS